MTDAKMYSDASFEIEVGRKYYHLEYGEVQPIAVVPGVVAGTVTDEESPPMGPAVLYEIINRVSGQNTTHADAARHFDENVSLMDEDGDGGGSSGGGGNGGGSPLATEGSVENQTPVEMTEQ